ncbi:MULTISPECIES: hypothetical protein [unclassified Methanoculleus]|uniref:hypothetical protein n=1 Tax=unclassified Methanoculleus TaxID=2619537 RepID=UPI0025D86E70|nr:MULTISPECIES: hypothetical protein [unclassified Methanoculleus]MCK9318847.1 hypothetical protein [Methanoculleus sp.]MDD2260311.1 hypothetical protein [Acholeplasmataceae bacterium]
MEFDRTFLLLCGAEVLVVAVGNLAAALILQVIVLGAFLDERRGYPVFAAGAVLFAAVLHVTGITVLLGLAVALGCGYLALTAYDYRLTLRAGERA